MSVKLFVTGTDTGIGKTYISVGLLKSFQAMGYHALGVKPIASGANWINGQLKNEDGLKLNQASSFPIDYELTNPIVFEGAVAPHIAAARENKSITLKDMIAKTDAIFNYPCDVHIVEGAGGWFVPLNEHETIADFVIHHEMDVILVVGIRLGCISHAILTYNAIVQANLRVAGWVANCFDDTTVVSEEIIQTLKEWLKAPCLAVIPYGGKAEDYLVSEV
ncbi:MAG: dethiobiotin synthase [Gammaproteobacteria bacterium]